MFNKIEFGNKIKEVRKTKGLTQENVCKAYGVQEISTISKYENGFLVPTIEQVYNFCEETEISISDLFKDEIGDISMNKGKNPFNSKKLYIYYKGYMRTIGRSAYLTFQVDVEEKDNYISLTLRDIKTNKIYVVGYLNSNDSIAILDFRNYKPTSPMLTMGVATIGLSSHRNGIYKGSIMMTNDNFTPSIRKCLISKELIEWNDDLKKEVEFTDEEINNMIKSNILETNIYIAEDYEI